jgi:hypothetical protein
LAVHEILCVSYIGGKKKEREYALSQTNVPQILT